MNTRTDLVDTAPLRKVVQRTSLRWRVDADELVCGHMVELPREKTYHAEARRCYQCLEEMNSHLARLGR